MARHRYRRPSVDPRRGFTLLELIVVLAVLAVVAALSWPAVRGLLAKSQLQNAAKQLRAALVRARLNAMESSTVRQFRHLPGTGRYEISVVATLDAPEDAGFPAASGAELGRKGVVVDALPGGVVFEGASALEDLLSEAGVAEDRGEGGWSAPVFFYPNGRTSGARFRLTGRGDYGVEVTLRAVTGTAAISQLEQVEPLP
jgi:prepilin-type N-terminal cleavage/methylation domain-containing protein